jgi:dUTP pyrophosphatase
MIELKIIVKRKDNKIPVYKTKGSAGLDLYPNLKHPITIKPMEILIVPTGYFIELPDGYEAQIRPRSGIASKYGITLINSPGTIDSDYRGEIKIPLINLGKEDFLLTNEIRIAQMVITRYEKVKLIVTSTLSQTERGEGGFGHTGLT